MVSGSPAPRPSRGRFEWSSTMRTALELERVNGWVVGSVLNFLDEVKPIYKQFKGWNCSIEKANSFSDLPSEAKVYIEFLSAEIGVPIEIISIGPKRHQILSLQ